MSGFVPVCGLNPDEKLVQADKKSGNQCYIYGMGECMYFRVQNNMKSMRKPFILFVLLLFALTMHKVTAQEKPQKEALEKAEEAEEPVIFKFEPEYLASMEARAEAIRKRKAIIDTLDISENKRRRLLRELYRNKESKLLYKYLLADTQFEDDPD